MKPKKISRHKTAIVRSGLSKPIQVALADGVIGESTTVFDYGCGKGKDLELLRGAEIDCEGWDPVHRPDVAPRNSDVVNLGYVINVIEDPRERIDVLKRAWDLAQRCLVVSARLQNESKDLKGHGYRDGFITGAGTFQRFYDQGELRDWVDEVLGERSVPAAPGVFFVFRDPTQREEFVSRRFRRRASVPRLRKSDVLFEQHADLLNPLMEFFTERGRLPRDGELPQKSQIEESALGSVRRAWRVVLTVTGEDEWAAITESKKEDLLIYLALARFGGRPKFSALDLGLQNDVKEFFSAYKRACVSADMLLFSAGDMEVIDRAMYASPVGKRTGNALYIHESALSALPAVLRVYEGCARSYLGIVDGANVIKLGRWKPRVSYLSYPGFDATGHPTLAEALVLKLGGLHTYYKDYSHDENPPVLHRKEQIVARDYRYFQRFCSLTKSEEEAGVLAVTDSIGTKNGWERVLRDKGLYVAGHKLRCALKGIVYGA